MPAVLFSCFSFCWGEGGGEGYSRVAIDATGTADIDYIPRLSILDSEVRRRGSDEFERCGVMQRNDCVPLFVCHLYAASSLAVNLLPGCDI